MTTTANAAASTFNGAAFSLSDVLSRHAESVAAEVERLASMTGTQPSSVLIFCDTLMFQAFVAGMIVILAALPATEIARVAALIPDAQSALDEIGVLGYQF